MITGLATRMPVTIIMPLFGESNRDSLIRPRSPWKMRPWWWRGRDGGQSRPESADLPDGARGSSASPPNEGVCPGTSPGSHHQAAGQRAEPSSHRRGINMSAKRATWDSNRIELMTCCFHAGLSCSQIAGEIGVTASGVPFSSASSNAFVPGDLPVI